MRDYMNILNESWLDKAEAKHVAEIVAKYPEIKPGQFVQLTTWFGDVWAEITSVYYPTTDSRYSSVSYISYDKYGVGRKEQSANFNKIRKIADASEINLDQNIVHTRDVHYSPHGKTDWTGLNPSKDRSGYQKHPTKTKPVR